MKMDFYRKENSIKWKIMRVGKFLLLLFSIRWRLGGLLYLYKLEIQFLIDCKMANIMEEHINIIEYSVHCITYNMNKMAPGKSACHTSNQMRERF